ncbi:hypothetical protein IWX90DRAFT_135618 [Phyllosticta citrichinensis]|uniref:Uncharacterized protein n=1 Tax=Phyllosticta citrichinensis TaxID=1130410 RepID=A0ABR1XXY0_9PEZI
MHVTPKVKVAGLVRLLSFAVSKRSSVLIISLEAQADCEDGEHHDVPITPFASPLSSCFKEWSSTAGVRSSNRTAGTLHSLMRLLTSLGGALLRPIRQKRCRADPRQEHRQLQTFEVGMSTNQIDRPFHRMSRILHCHQHLLRPAPFLDAPPQTSHNSAPLLPHLAGHIEELQRFES